MRIGKSFSRLAFPPGQTPDEVEVDVLEETFRETLRGSRLRTAAKAAFRENNTVLDYLAKSLAGLECCRYRRRARSMLPAVKPPAGNAKLPRLRAIRVGAAC